MSSNPPIRCTCQSTTLPSYAQLRTRSSNTNQKLAEKWHTSNTTSESRSATKDNIWFRPPSTILGESIWATDILKRSHLDMISTPSLYIQIRNSQHVYTYIPLLQFLMATPTQVVASSIPTNLKQGKLQRTVWVVNSKATEKLDRWHIGKIMKYFGYKMLKK